MQRMDRPGERGASPTINDEARFNSCCTTQMTNAQAVHYGNPLDEHDGAGQLGRNRCRW
jgi:hypothetical protein